MSQLDGSNSCLFPTSSFLSDAQDPFAQINNNFMTRSIVAKGASWTTSPFPIFHTWHAHQGQWNKMGTITHLLSVNPPYKEDVSNKLRTQRFVVQYTHHCAWTSLCCLTTPFQVDTSPLMDAFDLHPYDNLLPQEEYERLSGLAHNTVRTKKVGSCSISSFFCSAVILLLCRVLCLAGACGLLPMYR